VVPYRTRRQNSNQLRWATNTTEELTELESNCHEFKTTWCSNYERNRRI